MPVAAPPSAPAAPPSAPAAPSLPDPECARGVRDERDRVKEERESAELRRLQSALEQDPKNAERWAELGDAHGDRWDNAAAVEALEHATRLAPEVARYWHALGNYRSYLDDPAQLQAATAAFSTCLEKDPKLLECQWNLGHVYEGLGDLPAARDALKRTLELGGDCDLELAGVQLELGDVDAADALVRAGLEKERARGANADKLYFYFQASKKIAERRGDAAAAAAAHQQVVEATPGLQPEVAFNLGSTYAVMKPPRVEASERLLSSFVRNTCDRPNHAQYCDQCAVARDLLEKLSQR
jgi:tetratricopeptide (TPR) repeat protein